MRCAICTSTHLQEFPAEVNIHFPGIMNTSEPGVFVFPKFLCLDCGYSSFTLRTSEIDKLCTADEPRARQGGVNGG